MMQTTFCPAQYGLPSLAPDTRKFYVSNYATSFCRAVFELTTELRNCGWPKPIVDIAEKNKPEFDSCKWVVVPYSIFVDDGGLKYKQYRNLWWHSLTPAAGYSPLIDSWQEELSRCLEPSKAIIVYRRLNWWETNGDVL